MNRHKCPECGELWTHENCHTDTIEKTYCGNCNTRDGGPFDILWWYLDDFGAWANQVRRESIK